MAESWIPIPDDAVRAVWRPDCACYAISDDDRENAETIVPPTEYANSGVPICQDCGADFVYNHSEIDWSKLGALRS